MKDVIIIGGGPAGLSAALYAVRAGLSVLIIDKGAADCQLTKAAEVENYPGVSGSTGEELYEKFVSQVKAAGVEILKKSVVSVEKENKLITVYTKKDKFICKNVIISSGRTHRVLGIAGEERFLGAGVSYCATCDGYFFKNKTVCVIGGGDSALSEAVYLSQICKKVYIVHRRDTFRAARYLVKKAEEKVNIEFVFNSLPAEIIGDNFVKSLKYNTLNGREELLECDGIFVAIGEIPNMKFNIEGLAFDEKGYIITDNYCRTNVSGISAAGDIRKKELYQVVSAVYDGALAIEGILKTEDENE